MTLNNNLKIAVTGGMGSGKSTVCKILKDNGAAVFSCDEIYNELLQKKDLIKKIASLFEDAITIQGNLDKRKLASIVFSDKAKLDALNSITHPEIFKRLFEKTHNYKICYCEVPLLFEHGYEKLFDAVIVVLRDKELRIKSVVKRDGLNIIEAEERIKAQIDYDNYNFEKYYVLHNKGNFEDLTLKVQKIKHLIEEKKH